MGSAQRIGNWSPRIRVIALKGQRGGRGGPRVQIRDYTTYSLLLSKLARNYSGIQGCMYGLHPIHSQLAVMSMRSRSLTRDFNMRITNLVLL